MLKERRGSPCGGWRFLDCRGELAGLIAAFDWSKTALGPIEQWPHALKSTVATVIRSPAPMALFWGSDGIMLYNDAYARIAGGHHPRALGSGIRDGWAETAGFNVQALKTALAGDPVSLKEQSCMLQRHDKPEEVWLNLDYSPVLTDDGEPGGVLAVLFETRGARELREIEASLRRAQEAGGVGLFALDLATQRVSGTAEFCRIYGLDICDQVPAEQVAALLVPEDWQKIAAARQRDWESAPLAVEYRIRRPDTQQLRWIARKAEYERDADGKPVRLVGVIQDVTERREAQRAAEESAAQFRAFAQSLPNHVWTAKPSGELDWFNDRILEYGGADPGREIDGNSWPDTVHPADVAATVERWREALESGNSYEAEFRIRRHDGVYRWHLARAVPLRDSDGNISRWLGSNTDIHEQKLAEAESSRDRERIWKSTHDLMATAATDGYLKSVNPAWHRLLGYSEEELLAEPAVAFIPAEDQARYLPLLAGLRRGEPVRDLELHVLHKDGRKSLIAWSAEPVGDIFYVVGRDVTQQRAAEEALRQSQKMEAVGQLTGGIAHDFNNLLQGIGGSLTLIQKRLTDGRPPDAQPFIEAAMAATNRAAALTHRLLAFARRQPLDPRPLHANPLIASMEELLRRTLGEGVTINTLLAADLWLTRCDPHQLESAILNLVINARDAMPQGGNLTIATRNVDFDAAYSSRMDDVVPGGYVCISVTDTGVGMSADTASKAFEPFFTTKPIGQGTGLGLSMIYGFARQSKGHATIHSALGQGTTVEIYLPRDPGEGEMRRVDSPTAPASVSYAHGTVLVIEDEALVRALIVEVLTDDGYLVLEASDGPAGLDILQSRAVDLLVTDVGLPGLNGRQVAEAARLLQPKLNVLFMTGYAQSAAGASGFLQPGMSLITKPFAIEEFSARVVKILRSEPGDDDVLPPR